MPPPTAFLFRISGPNIIHFIPRPLSPNELVKTVCKQTKKTRQNVYFSMLPSPALYPPPSASQHMSEKKNEKKFQPTMNELISVEDALKTKTIARAKKNLAPQHLRFDP